MDRIEMSLSEALAGRRSIRRYTADPVEDQDLMSMLEAARLAPSGKNRQPWRFVVVKNRRVLQLMADAVEAAALDLIQQGRELGLEKEARDIEGWKRVWTFFTQAPLAVVAFELQPPPDPRITIMRAMGADFEGVFRLRARPPLQGVCAAIENLLLAAHALGYGACWMTAPVIAAPRIEELLGVDPTSYHLVAVIPIGRPAETPRPRPRKAMAEIATILE